MKRKKDSTEEIVCKRCEAEQLRGRSSRIKAAYRYNGLECESHTLQISVQRSPMTMSRIVPICLRSLRMMSVGAWLQVMLVRAAAGGGGEPVGAVCASRRGCWWFGRQ